MEGRPEGAKKVHFPSFISTLHISQKFVLLEFYISYCILGPLACGPVFSLLVCAQLFVN